MTTERKLTSYSQNGEDDLVWKYFNRKSDGLIIEVGAFDGIHFSNSYALEKLGWQAVLLEPHPHYYQLVVENRPRARTFNCAAVANDSTTEVEFMAEEIGLLSGINPDLEDVRKRYEGRGLDYRQPDTVKVEARTLNSILRELCIEPDQIDCITIDVEGTEVEVLKGLDIGHYRPRLLIVESNNEAATAAIDQYFNALDDYHFARQLSANRVYVRGAAGIKTLAAIAIDCQIAENIHPKGDKYTVESSLQKKNRREEDLARQRAGKTGLWARLKRLF